MSEEYSIPVSHKDMKQSGRWRSQIRQFMKTREFRDAVMDL